MKITCNSCGKTLNIPDEKIPPNKKVSISCPACKNKITVEKPEQLSEDATKTEKSEPAAEGQHEEALELTDPSQFADEELDILEEGAKRALVCDTTNQEKIVSQLKEMGYIAKAVTSSSEAIGRIKFTEYDVVVLSETFAGSTVENNSTLKYIQPMPMVTRRKMFVVLLGNNFRTMDNMASFALSVNVVINNKDIDNLDRILKKSILDNDAFYKVFRETLISIGKA